MKKLYLILISVSQNRYRVFNGNLYKFLKTGVKNIILSNLPVVTVKRLKYFDDTYSS